MSEFSIWNKEFSYYGNQGKTHAPWIPETQKELTKKVWMGLWGRDGAGISEAG